MSDQIGGIAEFVKMKLAEAPAYGGLQGKELESLKDIQTSGRLLRFYELLPNELRPMMLDVAANPIFREILRARLLECQHALVNLSYHLDPEQFRWLYTIHHLECELLNDILEVLANIQMQLQQQQHPQEQG